MPIYFVVRNMKGLGYWLAGKFSGPHFVFQIPIVIAAKKKKGWGFLTYMACVERKKSIISRAASHTNMVGWLRWKGHGPPYLLPFPLSMINQNAHDRKSLVGPTCQTLPSATSPSHYHPRQPNTRPLHHSHQHGLGGFALFTRNLDRSISQISVMYGEI